MSWNHRILAHLHNDEIFLQIHEVYYDEQYKPNGYTENGASVSGETIEEIQLTLNRVQECLKKPILWAGKRFPEEFNREEVNNG